MDRRHLALFVAVVDHEGFSAAADALGLAQPTVSVAVATLERELGMPLLQRLPRGVRPTAAGAALVEPARAVLRDFAVVESVAAAMQGLHGGSLDVVAIPTLTHELAELVGRFRALHPAVTVRCADPGVQSIESLVRSGACDLGLGEVPEDVTGLTCTPLGAQPFLLALPPGSAVPAALADLAFVATPVGTSSRAMLEEAVPDPVVVVETAQREALVPLVVAGAGAALLPEPLARQAAGLGARVLPTTPAVTRPFALLQRVGPLAPAAAAFVAAAVGVSHVTALPAVGGHA